MINADLRTSHHTRSIPLTHSLSPITRPTINHHHITTPPTNHTEMSINIPNLFLLNASGEMLVEKQWLGRFDRQVCDLFFELTSKETSRNDIAPIIPIGPYYFLQTSRNDIFFLTIVEQETNPGIIFEFQQLVLDTLLTYISSISENAIRENFVLIYQLLDEMNHGGFAYTTEKNQLLDMIAPPSLANKMLDIFHIGSPTSTLKGDLSSAAVSKIPWRRDNVSYLKNAVYFDIIESIDAVLSPDGSIVSSLIHGEVQCKSQLSGVPDLALSLHRNPPILDCSLHRCVRLARFERDRIISFVPPDGEFTLCNYKVDSNINIPIYVRPEFNWTQDKCTFTISFGQKASFSSLLEDIAIVIPIPKACSATVTQVNIGTVRTDQLTHTCRWEVPEMPKDSGPLKNDRLASGSQRQTIPTITGTFTLTRDVPADERPTLRVLFMLKKYSSSGATIDGLVVKNVNYEPVRGVRAICKAGKLQVRTQ